MRQRHITKMLLKSLERLIELLDVRARLRQDMACVIRQADFRAQRDVIDLTMLEAAIRAGNMELAQALTAERALAKHDSPLVALFTSRLQPSHH